MQREDLFLKELQNFIKFLQRLLAKDDSSSIEELFVNDTTNDQYLKLINTEFFEPEHIDLPEKQPSQYLQELCLYFLEMKDMEKAKTTYAIYTTKSKTIDLAIENKIQKLS